MAITRTIIEDTAEFTRWRDEDPAIGYVGFGIDYKAGTPVFNRDQQRSRLASIAQSFMDNYTNWGTLTNAQKDTANRNAQRALANLVRLVLEDFSTPGV